MRLLLIVGRQQCDDARAPIHHRQALGHLGHEIGAAEVLVLDESRVAGAAQDLRDLKGDSGILAGARDEEIAMRSAAFRHRPVPTPSLRRTR